MRVTVTTYDIDPAELAQLRQVLGLDAIAAGIDQLTGRQMQMSADFTALNATIEEHNQTTAELATELTAALARIEEDVQALQTANSDEADQAAVNAATDSLTANTAAMRESVDRLRAVDPVPPVVVPDEPGDPTNPDEPGNPDSI